LVFEKVFPWPAALFGELPIDVCSPTVFYIPVMFLPPNTELRECAWFYFN